MLAGRPKCQADISHRATYFLITALRRYVTPPRVRAGLPGRARAGARDPRVAHEPDGTHARGMPKPLPMPVHVVLDHPAVRGLPNAAHHLILELAVAYWLTDCRDLPTANHDLAAIGRTDVSTFARHCNVITYALTQLRPLLASAHVAAARQAAIRASLARVGGLARQAAIRKAAANQSPARYPVEPPTDGVQAAARKSGYRNPTVDMQARSAIVGGSRGMSAREGAALLSDSGIAPVSSPLRDVYEPWDWQPDPAKRPIPEGGTS